ncbi:MAG: adenylate/guanylate cyclase domain-containing protein [Actinobacteria bacterium]|nr:adenylate/guanylate cyclase domain-containing protein [Actinomycetota bacterium]
MSDEEATSSVFDHVRDVVEGDAELTLEQVADEADVPAQVLREAFAAMNWDARPGYDERDVAYARALRRILDLYPLDVVVRNLRTRYRGMTTIVVSDLGTVRDRVIAPALEGGADTTGLAVRLGETAGELLPLITGQLAEDYRHILVGLLGSDAVSQGAQLQAREVDLAVGFVDLVEFTKLSRKIDPAGLDRLLGRFEELVTEAVDRIADTLLAKFVGDAAMVVGSDPLQVARVLLHLVDDRQQLTETPRHAGLAYGRVLVREGDFYGQVPNLASRLTDHAKPWSILAADELADRLEDHFELSSVPPTHLHGIGEHRPYRVRSSSEVS